MGERLCEFVVKDVKPGISKLVWCRKPWEKMVLSDGQANLLFHSNFPTGDAVAESEARAAVRAEVERTKLPAWEEYRKGVVVAGVS